MAQEAKHTAGEFPVGTKFRSRGKHPREYTVIDIWRTYNAAGEMVRLRYVATYQMLGQTITDHDVVGATISMGRITAPAGA